MTDRAISVSLDGRLMAFVDLQVGLGHHRTAEDVLRAGLHLLEEREAKLSALRAALVEGEQSGPPAPFDVDGFIARKQAAKPPRP